MFEPQSLHQRQVCFDARVKTRIGFRHNLITPGSWAIAFIYEP